VTPGCIGVGNSRVINAHEFVCQSVVIYIFQHRIFVGEVERYVRNPGRLMQTIDRPFPIPQAKVMISAAAREKVVGKLVVIERQRNPTLPKLT
jgi:hypothetical protein